MATQYRIMTNDVQVGRTFSSKARAIAEAEILGKAAAERAQGERVTVETVLTGKRVFTYYAALSDDYMTPKDAVSATKARLYWSEQQDEWHIVAESLTAAQADALIRAGYIRLLQTGDYYVTEAGVSAYGLQEECTCAAQYLDVSFHENGCPKAENAPVSASEAECVGFVECPCRKCHDTRVKVTEEHSQHSEHTAYCLTCKGNREIANDVHFAAPAQDAPMANWEREVMETGTVAPEPAKTLCQDCHKRPATIFDTDAPMCEECYMSSLPASVSTPATTPHTASKPKSGKWDAVLAVKSPTGIYSLPSVDNFPNERAYQSAMENADDMCREQGFTFYGPEWLHAFKSSYALSLEIQAEEENNTRYVGVKQNVPGFQGVEHVHIAGCRDIAREMKRWGQKETDTFSYYAGITYADLTFDNWGDIASDNYADPYNEREAWLDMLSWMNDDLSGVKIMPCAQKMELGDTPFGPIVRDGAYYTIEESPIEESPVSEPISQSGVTDCTECGAHIMVNDITVPSQCEDGCPEDTRTPEDMADTMTAPLTIEAQLSVVVDGVTIDLGWHEFTLSAGQTEHDIPAMYGEKNGTWSRPGAPDWASVITVTATGACWH